MTVVTTAVTDARGTYRFPNLAPGTYVVTASLSGFTTMRREGIRVEVYGEPALPTPVAMNHIHYYYPLAADVPAITPPRFNSASNSR